MKRYVAGFLFNELCTSVALVQKKKPEWQNGLWNGIGGKIEDGEDHFAAMQREFLEETGVDIDKSRWTRFAVLSDGPYETNFEVNFYYANGPEIYAISTMEEEIIERHNLDDVLSSSYPFPMIPNLRWLIPMALSMANTPGIDKYVIQEQGVLY